MSCKHWHKYTDKDGYGMRKVAGRVVRVHRLAYAEANNLELSEIDGKVVRHTCDTPSCYNPDHLVIGSVRDNVLDMHKRGRAASKKGELHGRSVLTAADVEAIRSDDRMNTVIAKQYGVSPTQIGRVKRGSQWQ
jgi:hypothetical protein